MNTINDIPASKFRFVGTNRELHDKKLDSKPIGYFRDAMNRFVRNKSSVVAAIIIMILILYAVFVPMLCQNTYTRSLTDTLYLQYAKLPPKFEWLGIDGTSRENKVNKTSYIKYLAIGRETGLNPVVEVYRADYKDDKAASETATFYDIKLNNYYNLGMMERTFTPAEFEKIQAWQDETGIQVLYPVTNSKNTGYPNIWYQVDSNRNPILGEDGFVIADYKTTTPTDTSYHSLRIEADNDPEHPFAYGRKAGTSQNLS